MERLLLVALGGAVGASMRFGVNEGMARLGGDWPWATLIVNVAGCFLIGWLGSMALDGRLGAEGRALLVVGLLGGLTTFSAYGWEVVEFLREGRFGPAIAVVALNNILSLGAVWAGWLVSQPGEAG